MLTSPPPPPVENGDTGAGGVKRLRDVLRLVFNEDLILRMRSDLCCPKR